MSRAQLLCRAAPAPPDVVFILADTKAVVPIPNPKFDPAKYQPELEGKGASKAKSAKRAAAEAPAPASIRYKAGRPAVAAPR